MSEKEKWELVEGAIVGKRYKIGKEIGRGGMGVVHEGEDLTLRRPVAIKLLSSDYATDAEAVLRLEREALATAQIGHENICNVYDLGTAADGAPYIVMELLRGESLFKVLEREGLVEPERAIEITFQALSALAAIHQKDIIHRDIKPENIFLTTSADGGERVKLLDFGISKWLGEPKGARLTRTGNVLGSPYYMSPEQAKGLRDIDCRTDLWGVGVVLYEMLTGRVPFEGEGYNEVLVKIITEPPPDPKSVAPDVSDALAEVIRRALAWNLEGRFATAAEFATALLKATVASDSDAIVEMAEEIGSEEEVVAEAPLETLEEEESVEDFPRRGKWRSLFTVEFIVLASIGAGGLFSLFGWWWLSLSPSPSASDVFSLDASPAATDAASSADGDVVFSDTEGEGDGGTRTAEAVPSMEPTVSDASTLAPAEKNKGKRYRPRRREKREAEEDGGHPQRDGDLEPQILPPPKRGILPPPLRILPPPNGDGGVGSPLRTLEAP